MFLSPRVNFKILTTTALTAILLCVFTSIHRQQSGAVTQQELRDTIVSFMVDWCRLRRFRADVDSALGLCVGRTAWNFSRTHEPTSARHSFISGYVLRPAGQFSRFYIQAVTESGGRRTEGGDWWRIKVLGPAAIKPTIFDLRNGTYEVLFLTYEPGLYHVEIYLDYTLCDGFMDPPDNWFKIGNSQGKMQPQGSLKGRAKDFLMEPFQNGKEITINIAIPNGKGLYFFNGLPENVLEDMRSLFDFRCGLNCRLVWDGFGRWKNNTWIPHLKPRKVGSHKQKFNTFWIYGDSQAKRMLTEVNNTRLCRELFSLCNVTFNWTYRYLGGRPHWDTLDFDYRNLIRTVGEVLLREEMRGNSVMILNLGLHYLQGTNFSNYKLLMRSMVDLFKSTKTNPNSVRMIWKTTTSVNREKDLPEYLTCDRKRFLNNPRVVMFNAHATSLMCKEGFEVLDIHPLTWSYPHGTGGPDVEYYKEHDIVHFEPHVVAPFEDILIEYLNGNLPEDMTFSDYKFF